jgi:hypothetical protein
MQTIVEMQSCSNNNITQYIFFFFKSNENNNKNTNKNNKNNNQKCLPHPQTKMTHCPQCDQKYNTEWVM